MRTLYFRIIVITMAIMIASSIIAFVISNLYYQYSLKPNNDQKVTEIAKDIVTIYEKNNKQKLEDYLAETTALGFQFYLVDDHGKGRMFGKPFRNKTVEGPIIQKVMTGGVYHGIENYPWSLFVTGFFDNDITNTIGVPIEENGKMFALFVRPNTVQQFGEMRSFLAVLLILVLVLTFLLVLISTRYIVKPIKKLTMATRKIAAGNYHIKLNVARRDEIGRLAEDFSKMSDALARTEEKRQAFVSSVSHEIQSPLSSIKGFSQALREEKMTHAERDYYLSIIEKESSRLSQLSKQLLTLASLDNETGFETKENVALQSQLQDILATTEWLWRQKDIAVELNTSEVIIAGDAKLLYQVWMNLLTNAIRYTDDGGKIQVNVYDDKSNVSVAVSDTGIGIANENIPELFDRFYKVDKARTRTDSSTGLGLSIVKKIVELHNGTIMVESELEKGSTFTVTLPKK